MKPFVKWAGGKRQILERINNFIQASIEQEGNSKNDIVYFEPFLGGGAVLLNLLPKKAVVNDLNSDLINAYKIIQSSKIDDLINKLENYQAKYKNEDRDELYYSTRSKDRTSEWNRMSDVEKAARMIFLNRTCYNGLYRVNSSGQFNTPMGRYKNPLICDKELINNLSNYFNKENIEIYNGDYYNILKKIKKGDFIYLDPPYDPISNSSSFTGYTSIGFNQNEQVRLKMFCDEIHKKGAYFLLSNSDTKFIKELYNEYNISIILANRSISCDGNNRNKVCEVLIRNYE